MANPVFDRFLKTGHLPGSPTPWSYELHELSSGYSAIVYDANGQRVGTDHLTEIDARRIVAGPDYHAAVCGTDPDLPREIRPVSWLRSLIQDARKRGPAEDDDDPQSWWEMLSECEALLAGLEAAARRFDGLES